MESQSSAPSENVPRRQHWHIELIVALIVFGIIVAILL